MQNNFTIISCYTKSYENDAALLRNSLKELDLNNSQIELYQDTGSWRHNLKEKPKFIKRKLEELKSPVVWTDADSVLLQYPEYLDTLNCDIAIWRGWKDKTATGTIYFNYTDGAFYVLNEWLNNYSERRCDGKNLSIALQRLAPSFMKVSTDSDTIKISRLPFTYSYYHIDETIYKKLCNDEAIIDLKELNVVFAHTRGYNRYFKSKGLR